MHRPSARVAHGNRPAGARTLRPAAILLSLLAAWPVHAGPGSAPPPPTAAPRVTRDLPRQAYEPRRDDDTTVASESWDYVFSFPNGYRLLAQFQVTNAGPRRRHGFVTAVVVLPDRTTRVFRNSRPRGEWQSELVPDQVRLSLGRHRFTLGRERHQVHVTHHEGRFEIEAETTTPAVELGRVPEAGASELTLLAPRLRCRGVLQLPGQAPVELADGWGVATLTRSSQPAHRQARSSVVLHAFDPALQWSLFALATPRERGQESAGWLLLSRDGGSPEVLRAERRWAGAVRDLEAPHYLTPRELTLHASGADARVTLRPVARFDVLGWIKNPLTRFLAGRSSHPVQYLFDARYELRVGAGPAPLTGEALMMLAVFDQPQPEWP